VKRKPRPIEDRIREIASSKIKIRITGRTKSSNGFIIEEIRDGIVVTINQAWSKAEALQFLLAKVRCMDVTRLNIKVSK
jgi:hypothetical protein